VKNAMNVYEPLPEYSLDTFGIYTDVYETETGKYVGSIIKDKEIYWVFIVKSIRPNVKTQSFKSAILHLNATP